MYCNTAVCIPSARQDGALEPESAPSRALETRHLIFINLFAFFMEMTMFNYLIEWDSAAREPQRVRRDRSTSPRIVLGLWDTLLVVELWWCVGDAVWGVVYCLARALHSEDLRTWCSARVSQWLVLRRVRGGVLRPP